MLLMIMVLLKLLEKMSIREMLSHGYVNIFLRGEGAGFSVTAGVTFSAVDFSSFAPSITFSYVS